MNDPLLETLADAVSLLEREALRYALIGGLAVSIRGKPRVTVDVDFVVDSDVDRMLALLNDLPTTLFEPLFSGVREVVERSYLLPIVHRSTGVKVDLAVGASGFERQAVTRSEELNLDGTNVFVATVEDLLIMKALASRPQDDIDLRTLLSVRGDDLDWNYCLTVAAQLGEAVDQDILSKINLLRNG